MCFSLVHIDIVGWQNIIDVREETAPTAFSEFMVQVAGHAFYRVFTDGALYSPGSGVLRTGSDGSQATISGEVDFVLKYRLSHHAAGILGAVHFLGSFH